MSNLLQIKNISKTYTGDVILSDVSFTVGEKKKIGVIGRNGAGKSTLFRIITGTEKQTEGEIVIFDKTRIGYIEQEEDFSETETVIGYLLRKTKREDWECRKVAATFQLKNDLIEKKVRDLSGGYQMRVKLVAMILHEPNLLLLDEPTNYLDLSTMFLLEKFLLSYKGAYMIISHDKEFLASVCKEIVEIESGEAYYFRGSLEAFFTFKKEKLETTIKFNKKQDKKQKHLQSFVDRFRYKASKAKQAQSKLKQLEKIEKQIIKANQKNISLHVPDVKVKNGLAIRMNGLEMGYGDKLVVKTSEMDIEKGEHIAILGDNGQGKTTFMRTIAGDLEKMNGRMRWMPHMEIAYYAQHLIDALNFQEKVGAYLEARSGAKTKEDVIRVASSLLFSQSDLEKTVSVLSGGEKARLCLAGLLLSGANVLLLDEPTNHLDFETVEVLINALKKSKATILFISHNRTFINSLADKIIEVKNGGVKRFGSSYDDYIFTIKKQVDIEVEVRADEEEKREVKRRRREVFEENKHIRNQIQKIEKKLDKCKLRKQEILDIFESNPTQENMELSRELKDINENSVDFENKWLELNSKIFD
jgi:ATP-binding cassette, subfamily F, member 3